MRKSNKALVLSALAALAFGAGAVGTTFALFTSQAEANVTVTTGKVDVKAVASDLKTYSMDVEQDDGKFENGGTAAIDGTSVVLNNITPGDKVTFKIAVSNSSTVKTKYRTKVIAENDTGLYDGLKFNIANLTSMGISDWEILEAVASETELATYECSVELPKDAGNEYQDTSCKLAFSLEAVQGNAEVKNDTKFYNLEEFNALTEIGDEVENVYLHLGKQSVTYGEKLTIGNTEIGDTFAYVDNNGEPATGNTTDIKYFSSKEEAEAFVAPEGYRINCIRPAGGDPVRYTIILESDKKGFDLHVGGTINITDMPSEITELGVNSTSGSDIAFSVPGNTNITADGLTVNGVAKIFTKRSSPFVSSSFSHKAPALTMQNCNLNMCWIYDGLTVEKIKFDNCIFDTMAFKGIRNSNPIWWRPTTALDIEFNDCTIKSILPVKFETPSTTPEIAFNNCTFDIAKSEIYSKDTRNYGVLFGSQNADDKYGDVTLTGNKIINETAGLVSFYDDKTAWKDGCYLKLNDNVLNGTKPVQMYKTAVEVTGDYITGNNVQ